MEKYEMALVENDLAKLEPSERLSFYNAKCKALGLEPLTIPFQYIKLGGKLQLYATKNCSDQLRMIHNVSVKVEKEEIDENFISVYVSAQIPTPQGPRLDQDFAEVCITGLKGQELGNAKMKCHTKAKRRVTLSITGCSAIDDSELSAIPSAQRVNVNMDTGEVQHQKQIAQPQKRKEKPKHKDPACEAVIQQLRFLYSTNKIHQKAIQDFFLEEYEMKSFNGELLYLNLETLDDILSSITYLINERKGLLKDN